MCDARIEPGGPPDPRLPYIPAHRSARSARRVRRRTAADRRVMHRPWNAQRTATWPQPRRGGDAGRCGEHELRTSRLRAWPRREAEVVCLAAARIPQGQRNRGQEPNHGVGRRQRNDDPSDALYAHSPRVSPEHPGRGGARAALGLSGLGCAWRCGCGRRQSRARQVVWPRFNVAWRTRGSVVGSPWVCSCGAYPPLPHRALGPAPRAATRANWPRRRWTRLRLVASGPIWPLPYRESVSAAAESSVEEARAKPCARPRRP
jgi:hypothetical protein